MLPGKSIDRRTLLKGLGTAVALPLLDAMVPAFTRAATSKAAAPCRMAFLYVPNGIIMDQWIPTRQPGVTPLPAELPRVSSALAPFRNEVMILGGLTQNGGRALGDGPGDHGRAGASYLTCVHPKKTNGRDLEAGVSVDQIAARRLQGRTRFASLELGCEEGVQGGSCDNGYSCAYSNSISWRTPSVAESGGDPAARGIRTIVRSGRPRSRSGASRAPATVSEEHSRCGDGRCAASVVHAGRRG